MENQKYDSSFNNGGLEQLERTAEKYEMNSWPHYLVDPRYIEGIGEIDNL